jgi:CheY-like chemotaxis protein
LSLLDHRLTAALSGREALAKLEAGLRPDLIILDMNMPGMGGAETLPRIRVLLPEVPVLLATGRVDQTALNLVEAHPFVALMAKPFAAKALEERFAAIETRPS